MNIVFACFLWQGVFLTSQPCHMQESCPTKQNWSTNHLTRVTRRHNASPYPHQLLFVNHCILWCVCGIESAPIKSFYTQQERRNYIEVALIVWVMIHSHGKKLYLSSMDEILMRKRSTTSETKIHHRRSIFEFQNPTEYYITRIHVKRECCCSFAMRSRNTAIAPIRLSIESFTN